MPSLLTPKQLTLFSWPTSDPIFSPRVTSQTWSRVSRVETRAMRVTYLALEIVVAGEQQPPGHGRGD